MGEWFAKCQWRSGRDWDLTFSPLFSMGYERPFSRKLLTRESEGARGAEAQHQIGCVNAGVKSGQWAAQKWATLVFWDDARHEVAAKQPRSPYSWRSTGRLGPSGPIQSGSDQAVSVDLRVRLCARRWLSPFISRMLTWWEPRKSASRLGCGARFDGAS